MTDEQKKKIAEVMAAEHVAVITTIGDQWATSTLEAAAETPELDVVIILGESTDRFQNVKKRPQVSFLFTHRYGEVPKFQVVRLSGRGLAREVPKDSAEWNQLKALFLKKNPFEEPFFGNPALRMLRITPKTIKYADALNPPFTVEL
jgi:general stress protein 26